MILMGSTVLHTIISDSEHERHLAHKRMDGNGIDMSQNWNHLISFGMLLFFKFNKL